MDFLGIGWSFPPSFNQASEQVRMAEGVEDIQQSLNILLNTPIGYRVMRREFGCDIASLLFDTLDENRKTLLIDMVRKSILRNEARIDLEGVALNLEQQYEGLVLIEISYTVRRTNSRFNQVFPFYRNEGQIR
jgi:uncharacterized protein